MAGIPFNKDVLNHDVGSVTRQLYAAFANVKKLQDQLTATPNQTLTDMGFSAQDIADIKSAFTDMDNLRQVFEGGRNQQTAYDFRTFAKRLIGSGLF